MDSKRLHTPGFRGVVTAVVHVDAALYRIEIRVVRPFPRDECIETGGYRLVDHAAARTRYHTDALDPLGSTRQQTHRAAQHVIQPRRQRFSCDGQLAPNADLHAPKLSPRSLLLHA